MHSITVCVSTDPPTPLAVTVTVAVAHAGRPPGNAVTVAKAVTAAWGC
jgi:hypothetical protein